MFYYDFKYISGNQEWTIRKYTGNIGHQWQKEDKQIKTSEHIQNWNNIERDKERTQKTKKMTNTEHENPWLTVGKHNLRHLFILFIWTIGVCYLILSNECVLPRNVFCVIISNLVLIYSFVQTRQTKTYIYYND